MRASVENNENDNTFGVVWPLGQCPACRYRIYHRYSCPSCRGSLRRCRGPNVIIYSNVQLGLVASLQDRTGRIFINTINDDFFPIFRYFLTMFIEWRFYVRILAWYIVQKKKKKFVSIKSYISRYILYICWISKNFYCFTRYWKYRGERNYKFIKASR